MASRETGGVALAFGGFVLLVAAFKGTWRDTWNALTGKTGSGGRATTARDYYTPGSTSSTPASSNGATNPGYGAGAVGGAPRPFR